MLPPRSHMVGARMGGKSDEYAWEREVRHSRSCARIWKTYGENSDTSFWRTYWKGGKSIASKASTAADELALRERTSAAMASNM